MPMTLTVSGRVTEVREAQRLNARWLIVVTEAGRATEVRAVPLKARLPILVSAASVGIVSLVRERHPAKAPSPIVVTAAGS